jgi:H+/Cl- antiporter ClcA
MVSAAPGPAAAPPVTQKREFWVLMGYAVVLGVFGAFAGLVFIGVIKFGGKWYSDSDPGWFGGHWWWVAVAAAAGVVAGLLRRLTRLPQEVPGLFEDLKTEHVDPGLVPGVVAVSAVSLIGGASLGPEKALGTMGGGAGSWLAQRRALSKEDSQVNTLAGFAGAYGGLFSSTVIVVLLILESPARAGSGSPRPWPRRSWHRASRSASTSPSPAPCSWTTTRCRSTRSMTGSCSPGSPWACSRPWW